MAKGVCGAGVCMAKGGGMYGESGCAWQRRHVWQGGSCMAGEMTTAPDGTHPTGMHSCSIDFRFFQRAIKV